MSLHSASLQFTVNTTQSWQTTHKPKQWKPKSPEVFIPVREDIHMTDKQWDITLFPFNPIPDDVYAHVNTVKWKSHLDSLV